MRETESDRERERCGREREGVGRERGIEREVGRNKFNFKIAFNFTFAQYSPDLRSIIPHELLWLHCYYRAQYATAIGDSFRLLMMFY